MISDPFFADAEKFLAQQRSVHSKGRALSGSLVDRRCWDFCYRNKRLPGNLAFSYRGEWAHIPKSCTEGPNAHHRKRCSCPWSASDRLHLFQIWSLEFFAGETPLRLSPPFSQDHDCQYKMFAWNCHRPHPSPLKDRTADS